MRRLFPEPAGEASLDDLYGARREPVGDRPWVGLCMVASLDGSTVVDGRSSQLGNANDTSVLLRLRQAADVILVGASTVRHEQYGPPSKPGQRLGVVTASGSVDTSTSLFRSGAGFLVMPEDGPDAPEADGGTPVDVVRAGRGQVDVSIAVRRLPDLVSDVQFVHVEGGPHLNGSLLDADCVDELNLTISPALVGGDGPRLAVGATAAMHGFELSHLVVDEQSFTFTRWVRRR